MFFENRTAFQAKFVGIRLAAPEDAIGMVFVKATYDLVPEQGSWSVSAEPFPITTETVETPFGVFHGEVNPPREGVDVCVLATLRRERPVREAILTLTLNELVSRLRVVGDRTWRRAGTQLVPSSPAPFTEMPLSYRRAYGGQAGHEEAKVLWPDNPIGIGYYLTEEQAQGNALPNIEPAQFSGTPHWSRPVPVAGWAPYPNTWGLRVKQAYELEGERLKRVNRTLFNNAHPSLSLARADPGDSIVIDGLFERPYTCRIPTDQIRIQTTIGDQALAPPSRIDGLSLWVDQRKLVVTHRAVFPYTVRRHEPRQTVVLS
jgi:hypothetical protein